MSKYIFEQGMIYWITGLSGAGKTTISKYLCMELRSSGHSVVHLDGDELREIFSKHHLHSIEERLKLATSYSKLCQLIADQGVTVVCSTISMFDAIRSRNRNTFSKYFEVYLNTPLEILKQRDARKIYSRASDGELENVIGIHLHAEEPKNPDFIHTNDGKTTPAKIAHEILQASQNRLMSK